MLFYTKKQYESAIQEKDRRMDEVIDSFRDVIIEQLETIAKSDEYKEKYELLLREKGYYESIERDLQTSKDRDEVFKKYDLCFRGDGYGNSKCWYLLDKIEYKYNRLRFYISAYSSLPPDYGVCCCSKVPSKVLWNALKEFKKHITHLEDNASVDDNAEKALSIDEIMSFLMKERFMPQKQNDEYISFKYQEDTFEIHYSESRFEIFKRARFEKEEFIPAVEKAIFKTMQEAWFLDIFFLYEGNNTCFFSTQAHIETIFEMEIDFPTLLDKLAEGINRFNGNFHQIWQKMQETE